MRRYENAPGLSAYDVANTALYMLSVPLHMEVNDVLMRPTQQVV
jgi:NADP-dependent 3-hydroxy acid dehydrogenase YdfG